MREKDTFTLQKLQKNQLPVVIYLIVRRLHKQKNNEIIVNVKIFEQCELGWTSLTNHKPTQLSAKFKSLCF